MKCILDGASRFALRSVVVGIAMCFDTLDTVAHVATLLDKLISMHLGT